MTIKEVIEKYRTEHLSNKRVSGYFKTFEIYFANRELNKRTITEWLLDGLNHRLEKKYSADSLQTKYYLIRAAYMYCWHCGCLTEAENPFVGYSLPPQVKKQHRQMRVDEYTAPHIDHDIFEDFLFNFLKERGIEQNIQSMGLLAYFTGMRINECCTLKWTDVHADYIQLDKTKERHPRKVALGFYAMQVLQDIRQSASPYVFPCSADPTQPQSSKALTVNFSRHWRKYGKTNPAAKFQFSFKTLRTAFIQMAQYNGLAIEWIKKQVGHRTLYITDYSYNGSLCTRAIAEFNRNPANEMIYEISAMLRREISPDDVRAIDVQEFKRLVKEAIFQSRKIHHIDQNRKVG